MASIPAIDQQIIAKVCKQQGVSVASVTRFPSGQINRVYDINDALVLKIEGELSYARGIFAQQQNVTQQLLAKGATIPEVLTVGEHEGKGFLLMKKITGANVVYAWPHFSAVQKEKYIEQIAQQLQIFHSLPFPEYAIPMYQGVASGTLAQAVERTIDFSRIVVAQLPADLAEKMSELRDWYLNKKSILDETGTAVFVHNDIHLENVLHKDGLVTGIIDLDWWSAAPREYELRKMMDYFHTPAKCVEVELEKFYNHPMTEEIAVFKKHYPALFDHPQLLERIRLYYLNDIIDVLSDYQSGRWNESVLDALRYKIEAFYTGEWLQRALSV